MTTTVKPRKGLATGRLRIPLQRVYFGCALAALLLLSAADAAGQSLRVRIPGVIKKMPIEFSGDIANVVRLAQMDAKPSPKKGGDTSASGDRVHGVSFNFSEKSKVQDTRFFELVNPSAVTAIGTPIPLEAEIILVNSKTQQAKVGEIVTDSVAAWRRLKTWPDLKDPKKGLKSEDIAAIDDSAAKVNDLATQIMRSGKMTKEDETKLIESYTKLSGDLGAAYDKTSDFDIQKQLSNAIDGVRAERVAWSQVMRSGLPILNPGYAADQDPPKPSTEPQNPPGGGASRAPAADGAASGRSAEPGPKSAGSTISPEGPLTTYSGSETLQTLRPTLQYIKMYHQTRACVAICDGPNKAFATGTIIGKNLILTCAHAVARSGRGGKPAAKDRSRLMIKIGYDYPPDPGTPPMVLPAKIVFEGAVQDVDADPLDFTLLTADISGKYESPYIQEAEDDFDGFASKTMKAKKNILARLIHPIEPLPLADFPVTEADTFNIAGHPEGFSKLVCNNGKIIYPLFWSETRRDEEYQTLTRDADTPARKAELQQLFNNMYQLKEWPGLGTGYRFCYGNLSPGIGAVCSTVGGNSGGAAVLKGVDVGGIIGILVEGQVGRIEPWVPGVENHETLLPITMVIKQLNEKFKQEAETQNGLPPVPFPEVWHRHYGVTLLDRLPNGDVVPKEQAP